MVTIYHAIIVPVWITRQMGIAALHPDLSVAEVGAYGVDAFFVLSGFLMVYITGRRGGNDGTPARFLTQRLVRVWPMYALATALTCVPMIYLATRGIWSYDLSVYRLLSLAFIPTYNEAGLVQPIVNVGWTLNYEIMFYLCFACVMRLRGWPLLGALTAMLGALFGMGLLLPPGVWRDFLTHTMMFEFLLGVALGIARQAGVRLFPWTLIVLPLVLVPGAPRWIAIGGCALALLSWLVERRPGTARVRWLAVLGDASYSLYLLHLLIIQRVAGRTVRTMAANGSGEYAVIAAAILAVVCSVVAALICYRWVERPLTRALHRRVRAWQHRDTEASEPDAAATLPAAQHLR